MSHRDMVHERWCGLREAAAGVMRYMLFHNIALAFHFPGNRAGLPVHKHATWLNEVLLNPKPCGPVVH